MSRRSISIIEFFIFLTHGIVNIICGYLGWKSFLFFFSQVHHFGEYVFYILILLFEAAKNSSSRVFCILKTQKKTKKLKIKGYILRFYYRNKYIHENLRMSVNRTHFRRIFGFCWDFIRFLTLKFEGEEYNFVYTIKIHVESNRWQNYIGLDLATMFNKNQCLSFPSRIDIWTSLI